MNFKTFIYTILASSIAASTSCPESSTLVKKLTGIYSESAKGLTDVKFGFFHQLQLDESGNYHLYETFYCPKGVPCPVNVAPVLPTKGTFSVDRIECDLLTSFRLTLNAHYNTLGYKIEPQNREPRHFDVIMNNGEIKFIEEDRIREMNKLKDSCNGKFGNSDCERNGAKGAKCYTNTCKFVEKITL